MASVDTKNLSEFNNLKPLFESPRFTFNPRIACYDKPPKLGGNKTERILNEDPNNPCYSKMEILTEQILIDEKDIATYEKFSQCVLETRPEIIIKQFTLDEYLDQIQATADKLCIAKTEGAGLCLYAEKDLQEDELISYGGKIAFVDPCIRQASDFNDPYRMVIGMSGDRNVEFCGDQFRDRGAYIAHGIEGSDLKHYKFHNSSSLQELGQINCEMISVIIKYQNKNYIVMCLRVQRNIKAGEMLFQHYPDLFKKAGINFSLYTIFGKRLPDFSYYSENLHLKILLPTHTNPRADIKPEGISTLSIILDISWDNFIQNIFNYAKRNEFIVFSGENPRRWAILSFNTCKRIVQSYGEAIGSVQANMWFEESDLKKITDEIEKRCFTEELRQSIKAMNGGAWDYEASIDGHPYIELKVKIKENQMSDLNLGFERIGFIKQIKYIPDNTDKTAEITGEKRFSLSFPLAISCLIAGNDWGIGEIRPNERMEKYSERDLKLIEERPFEFAYQKARERVKSQGHLGDGISGELIMRPKLGPIGNEKKYKEEQGDGKGHRNREEQNSFNNIEKWNIKRVFGLVSEIWGGLGNIIYSVRKRLCRKKGRIPPHPNNLSQGREEIRTLPAFDLDKALTQINLVTQQINAGIQTVDKTQTLLEGLKNIDNTQTLLEGFTNKNTQTLSQNFKNINNTETPIESYKADNKSKQKTVKQ